MAEHLVIHIPGAIEPMDRGDRFEDPLDAALKKAGKLGTCCGGGTAFETEPAFRITGCDIEVEVRDLAAAIPVIRDVLVAGEAPAGTTVTVTDTEQVILRKSKAGWKDVKALSESKRPKRFQDSCDWDVGEVVGYRLAKGRLCLLHYYGFGFGASLWVPDWTGPKIPDRETVKSLVLKKPEMYRLGSVCAVVRESASDRDERNVIRTGIIVKPALLNRRAWVPGWVDMYTWKSFERTLKEAFGAVKVSPAVRLSHDLGLDREVVHFGIWDAAKETTAEDGRRLFYAFASAGHYKRHPDRIKPPVTEALKGFVKKLRSLFKSDRIESGDFSAKEAFMVVSVKRNQFDRTFPKVLKLAKSKGLTIYEPEKDRIHR